MTVRFAQQGDEAALEARFKTQANHAMFLRGNLRQHGLGPSIHPHGSRYLLRLDGRHIHGVAALTRGGYAMGLGDADDLPLWTAFATRFAGHLFRGVTGQPAMAGSVRAALGLEPHRFSTDEITPLFRLGLDRLPSVTDADLRAPTEADLAILGSWLAGFDAEALGVKIAPDHAAGIAARAEAALSDDCLRLLFVAGRPVAMTRFNAQLPDMVQVGGVYTPPDLRGRGYARRAVAAHLIQARRRGVHAAILFSANAAASRAYRAIGFRQVGDYAVALLPTTIRIGAA